MLSTHQCSFNTAAKMINSDFLYVKQPFVIGFK